MKTLPGLRSSLDKKLKIIKQELDRPEFSNMNEDSKDFRLHLLLNEFKEQFETELNGTGAITKNELTAGARLHGIFRSYFFENNAMLFRKYETKREQPDQRTHLLRQINFAHQNLRGIRSTPHSEKVLEDIVKDQIR